VDIPSQTLALPVPSELVEQLAERVAELLETGRDDGFLERQPSISACRARRSIAWSSEVNSLTIVWGDACSSTKPRCERGCNVDSSPYGGCA
jgi:hypothetical protein